MHNRAEFAKRMVETRFGAGSLAALREGMSCSEGTRGHAITYAENAQGEKVGKRDEGPWADVRMDGVWA